MEFASPFVSGAFSMLLQRLYPFVQGEIKGIRNVQEDMIDITRKMKLIASVLPVAERRALREEPIRIWLNGVKTVVHEIEDLVGDYEYEESRLEKAPCYKKMRKWKHFRDIEKRLPNIKENVSSIYEEVKKVGLDQHIHMNDKNDQNGLRGHKKASPIAPNVVGREIDRNTKTLVNIVTERDEMGGNGSIISITGMGGVGKTTLAQKVYSRIKEMGSLFDIVCWVSVTDGCKDVTLLKEMMESIDPHYDIGVNSKENPWLNLEKIIKGDNGPKKFFIVLDDIWKNDLSDCLDDLLRLGAAGSKVVITTRDVGTAKKLNATYIFPVNVLPEDEALSLLYRNVFTEEEEEDKKLLKSIGLQIVRKCDFLPLAIKAISGVLRTKRTLENEWRSVLEDDLWTVKDFDEPVMASLSLSYADLESSHKQCLLYMSLFPNKFVFYEEKIVQFWVAQGLIDDKKGKECYKSLVHRNLLQKDPRTYYSFLFDRCHVMHDLVHSFVRKLSVEEHAFSSGDRLQDRKVHGHSIANESIGEFPYRKRPSVYKSLRSIMVFDCKQMTRFPSKDVTKELCHLRVLKLEKTDIKVLPSYINKLRHLRLLDLSRNPNESLPESIGDLVNLQYLLLDECYALKALPKSLTKLVNLRSLSADIVPNQTLYVPRGLDRLTNLEYLSRYAAIEELGPLNKLKTLWIRTLEGVDVEGAQKVMLKDKTHLMSLLILCDLPWEKPEDGKMKEVLEILCPPPSVETLTFGGFRGTQLPSWLSLKCDTCFPNMTSLTLGTLLCVHLVQLGELPNLQFLHILGAIHVRSLGHEFFYKDGGRRSGARPFRKLKVLRMEKMDDLEECQWENAEAGCSRSKVEGEIIMPFLKLETLTVKDCTSLKFLWGCLHAAASLTTLNIFGCSSLTVIPELPAVTVLSVDDCLSITQAGPFRSLTAVTWKDGFGRVKQLPTWLACLRSGESPSAPSLEELVLLDVNPYVIRRLLREDIGLDWPFIRNIPEVHAEAIGTDSYHYQKSPFRVSTRIGKFSLGSEAVEHHEWPMKFNYASCGTRRGMDGDVAATPRPQLVNSNNKENYAALPREVVPATWSALVIWQLLALTGNGYDAGWNPLHGNPMELPLNCHRHVEVITTDGERQLLCIDPLQSHSTQAGFMTGVGGHTHLPFTTTSGQPAMACFSNSHPPVRLSR